MKTARRRAGVIMSHESPPAVGLTGGQADEEARRDAESAGGVQDPTSGPVEEVRRRPAAQKGWLVTCDNWPIIIFLEEGRAKRYCEAQRERASAHVWEIVDVLMPG